MYDRDVYITVWSDACAAALQALDAIGDQDRARIPGVPGAWGSDEWHTVTTWLRSQVLDPQQRALLTPAARDTLELPTRAAALSFDEENEA